MYDYSDPYHYKLINAMNKLVYVPKITLFGYREFKKQINIASCKVIMASKILLKSLNKIVYLSLFSLVWNPGIP